MAWTAGAAVLSACGAAVQPGGQAQAPTAASGQQPSQATVQPPADKSPGTNPATLRWEFRGSQDDLTDAKASLEKFTAKNPNITVNIELAPDQQRDEKLVTAMVGGTAPDVFEAWGDIVYKFADKGQVLDLQPYVDADMYPGRHQGLLQVAVGRLRGVQPDPLRHAQVRQHHVRLV